MLPIVVSCEPPPFPDITSPTYYQDVITYLQPLPEQCFLRIYWAEKGESLFTISRQMYGSGKYWHQISRANRLHGWRIKTSGFLIIPARTW